MSITKNDRGFFKSVTVTDTPANGGRCGRVPIISGALQNLFNHVSAAERTTGVTKYRKEFARITKAGLPAEVALDMMAYLLAPSTGGDRKAIAKGEAADTFSTFDEGLAAWVGPGRLNADLSGGETQIEIETEGGDIVFVPGGQIWIGDIFRTSQAVDDSVKIGESVLWDGAEWTPAAYVDDYIHPRGFYMGDNAVMSYESGVNHIQRIPLPENLTEDEILATGDGVEASPVLTDLAGVTNGLFCYGGLGPVVSATCSGVVRTVTIEPNGTCSGDCSAGEIDPATGEWVTPIAWVSPPDLSADVTVTYRDAPYVYSGVVATVDLANQVASAFAAAQTRVSGMLEYGDVVASADGFTDSSVGGIYDDSTYPVELANDGAEEDYFTLVMTSGTAFSASGASAGDLGAGNTSADFEPTNPATGTPFFALRAAGWTGAPQAGDQIAFSTHVGAAPIWWRQIVPAGTEAAERVASFLESTNE